MAESALDWWREAGLEILVDENPRHWLSERHATAEARLPEERIAAPIVAPSAPPAPVILPATLSEFEAWRLGPEAPDAGWSERRVGPQGQASGGLMVLLEAPEREDEAAGMLLSGAVGTLFDRMLAAIGRTRESIYLASVAVARPLAGRVPSEAIEELGRIARHQVGLAAPKRLLVIGNAASRAILGADIAQARGILHNFNHDAGTTGVVASFHPRFLMERPAAKAEAWRDLRLLMGGIDA